MTDDLLARARAEAEKRYPQSTIPTAEDFREVARYNFAAGAEWLLAQLPDREAVAEAIRDKVRIGTVGPNSTAVIEAGGAVHLTPSEAGRAADAVLDLIRNVGAK